MFFICSFRAMDIHEMQFDGIVKQEPTEVINCDSSIDMDTNLKDLLIPKTDLCEIYLSSTVKASIHLKYIWPMHLNLVMTIFYLSPV